jgi:hypothetical protein
MQFIIKQSIISTMQFQSRTIIRANHNQSIHIYLFNLIVLKLICLMDFYLSPGISVNGKSHEKSALFQQYQQTFRINLKIYVEK